MSVDFKKKRIVYLNNWPNVEPFEIEKKYYSLVEKIKNEHETIFIPYPLKYTLRTAAFPESCETPSNPLDLLFRM